MQKSGLLVCVIGFVAVCFASPFHRKRRASGDETPANDFPANNFGAGAAAGIGGLGRSAGIGNFQSDPRNNPYLPFGAFAGLNLGQRDGERVGAGCSGLTCGFQLGNLALSTRQLFDAVTNGNGSSGFDPLKLLQQPINMFQQFQQQFRQNRPDQNLKPEEEGQQPPSISEFARFGNNARKNGLFSGGAFSSTFGSGNGNPPLFQSTSIHMDGDGKVTTVESGSGMEDKVTTGRIGGSFGGGNGVFAATGTKVEPNGIISSFRHVGPLQ
ncbi:uncharacterized protein LOC110845523 isoform X2 [Folsomia candida]|uniref:uncharacterized protein LOC110845523 isoform X2 n=1 Tax=Folsomia candida TaxID=158441 RepID=UPI000B9009B4|nr:uncharacterized protein LOC110845523 isoform X2 [Folsomia candida]